MTFFTAVFINKGWPDNAACSRALDIHFSASTASPGRFIYSVKSYFRGSNAFCLQQGLVPGRRSLRLDL